MTAPAAHLASAIGALEAERQALASRVATISGTFTKLGEVHTRLASRLTLVEHALDTLRPMADQASDILTDLGESSHAATASDASAAETVSTAAVTGTPTARPSSLRLWAPERVKRRDQVRQALQSTVLDALRQTDGLSAVSLAILVGAHVFKVREALFNLEAAGQVRRTGGDGRHRRWWVGALPAPEAQAPPAAPKAVPTRIVDPIEESKRQAAAAGPGQVRFGRQYPIGHRVEPKTTEAATGTSSWLGRPREGFTEKMAGRREDMERSPVAARVKGLPMEFPERGSRG